MANNSTIGLKDNLQNAQLITQQESGFMTLVLLLVENKITIFMFPLKNLKKSINLQCVLKMIYITKSDVQKGDIFLPDFKSIDSV
jgi:hypothetical protein